MNYGLGENGEYYKLPLLSHRPIYIFTRRGGWGRGGRGVRKAYKRKGLYLRGLETGTEKVLRNTL